MGWGRWEQRSRKRRGRESGKGGTWDFNLRLIQSALKGGIFCLFVFLFGLWDLSSPTRDQTWALGSESAES